MSIVKNTLIVSITTLISRVFGYARDIIIAATLGTGPLNDAFVAAFKFANLFRNTFGEGALTAAFIPIFAQTISQQGITQALKVASLLQALLIIMLGVFVSIILVGMPYILHITTPGFSVNDQFFHIAVEVARITFPYLFFISLAAFYGGILNTINVFMPFAATSIIFNLSMILFASCCDFGETKAHSIAYGVLTAGVLELLWMLYHLKKNHISLPLVRPQITKEIKIILKRMSNGFLGSSIAQINTWVDMIIVSFISGGISYIYYADRLMQLPLAVVTTATSTALLPSLARHVAEKNSVAFNDNKDTALKISAFFLIPSAVFLHFFALAIVTLLLQRGRFDHQSAMMTAAALKYLAIGLPAFAIIKLFNSTFYAHGDTKTPVYIGIISLLINIFISCSLLKIYAHVAIAIASTISAWFVACTMVCISYRKKLYTLKYSLIRNTLQYFIIALISAYICNILFTIYNLHIIYCFALSSIVYVIICYMLTLRYKKI